MIKCICLVLVVTGLVIAPVTGCNSEDPVVLETQDVLGGQLDLGDDEAAEEEKEPEPGTAVVFYDAKLEEAVRAAINSSAETIYASEVAALTSIDARNMGITDLRGIEHCTNLGSVWLSGNQIVDLSPLAQLQGRTQGDASFSNLTIYLSGSGLTDISALAELTGPDELVLRLGRNSIVDVSPLSGLVNLIGLHLEYNQIVDVRPLAELTRLTQLNLEYNRITDASPLSGLTADIYLEGNPCANH